VAASEANLIEDLIHNANASGQRMLERRMSELAIWFYKNKGRIPSDNLAGRQAFLEKAFWIQLEIMALLAERCQEVEAMRRGQSMLWLPRGIEVNGSVKEFG